MDRERYAQKATRTLDFMGLLANGLVLAPVKDEADWWELRVWCMTRETQHPIFGEQIGDQKTRADRLAERIN